MREKATFGDIGIAGVRIADNTLEAKPRGLGERNVDCGQER